MLRERLSIMHCCGGEALILPPRHARTKIAISLPLIYIMIIADAPDCASIYWCFEKIFFSALIFDTAFSPLPASPTSTSLNHRYYFEFCNRLNGRSHVNFSIAEPVISVLIAAPDNIPDYILALPARLKCCAAMWFREISNSRDKGQLLTTLKRQLRQKTPILYFLFSLWYFYTFFLW